MILEFKFEDLILSKIVEKVSLADIIIAPMVDSHKSEQMALLIYSRNNSAHLYCLFVCLMIEEDAGR